MKQKQKFVLELQPMAGNWRGSVDFRIKIALKILGRKLGLKATRLTETYDERKEKEKQWIAS